MSGGNGLAAFIAGAPLGSHPLTGKGPYELRLAKRARRWKRALALGLLLLLASVTALAANAWAANMPGYWYTPKVDAPGASGVKPETGQNGSKATAVWKWYAQDGSCPDKVVVDGKEVQNRFEIKGAQAYSGPSQTPEGWYRVYSNSVGEYGLEGNKENPLLDPSTPEGKNPMWNETIFDNDPKFELSAAFFTNWAMKLVFNLCYEGSKGLLAIADWFMGIIGANAQAMLSQPFDTGTYADFYKIAGKVSDYAVEPYALAFLSVTFGAALLRTGDPRRKLTGGDWIEESLVLVAMFAVCTTLILHAIDLCAAAYWLAQNLVTGIGQALDAIGMSPTGMGAGTVSDPFLSAMQSVTYGEGGAVIVYMLLALFAMAVSAVCALTVLVTIFMRVGEIYLRAAASPLCLSFMVDDRARGVGMGYVKRFMSVCFQAAVIFVAIAMAPLFFQVATTIMQGVGATGSTGVGGALEAILPTIAALITVTSVVRSSEQVANSIFGLAG